jgi:hypothetical protein
MSMQMYLSYDLWLIEIPIPNSRRLLEISGNPNTAVIPTLFSFGTEN